MPEPLTPDAVRVLIAETDTHYDKTRNGETRCGDCGEEWPCLPSRAAAALSALLPREDALLARVRTAEAERDEAQRRLGVIADSARDGLEDCDDDHDMSAYWVLMVVTGQDEEDTHPRTVETAEEWEYGILTNRIAIPCDEEFATHRRHPARPAGPWESVPKQTNG